MLLASVVSSDPTVNLQLGLGIELSVLPPYLYALWSIKPQAEGASASAAEAARVIRSVAYEEMLHAGLAANVLSALGVPPNVTKNLMRYPGFLPGHIETGPYAFQVGLAPLASDTLDTFLKIELPEPKQPALPPKGAAGSDPGWVTIGQFYQEVIRQLEPLPASRFGHGRQLPPSESPGPGRLMTVKDAASAAWAIREIIEQGEGSPNDPNAQDDHDHEVAHYYQFETIQGYLTNQNIDLTRDVYPVIPNPDASKYSPAQVEANRQFNLLYTQLLDRLQAALTTPQPTVFGPPTQSMNGLAHAAAVLRNAGTVPGTNFVAGPTFEYLGKNAH